MIYRIYKRIFMSGWVSPHFYVANHHLFHNGMIYFEKEKKNLFVWNQRYHLTAVTSKEDMYDDKGEGEETRAVLPSSHSWRAPTPIRWLPSLPFHSSGFILAERSVRLHACVYEGARVLARASCA